MKIRVSFTIDIDQKAWAEEFGLDPEDVRADVQDSIHNMSHAYAAGLDLLAAKD